MRLTKNIRISLYILIPIIIWMISGFFVNDKVDAPDSSVELFSVHSVISTGVDYQPLIKLKATTKSEARLMLMQKHEVRLWQLVQTKENLLQKILSYAV